MKIKREILAFFLAIMLFPLTCGFAFADLNVGDYSLGGYLEMGGGFLANYPNARNRGYLTEYLPFPVGPLANANLTLKSKDELEYLNFRMSNPGLVGDQDFLLEMGKLGVWHAQVEYDQLQHVYNTTNNYNNDIGILVQRLRFSGYYEITPWLDLFAEDQWLRRTGQQPLTYEEGPTNVYEYTATVLRPIRYTQNDLKVGTEIDKPTYQFRVAYHLSTFDNGISELQALTTSSTSYVSLPPSNMANYITAEGGYNLLAYKTRITGSLSYGWLTQNDQVYSEYGTAYQGAAGGAQLGDAGLSASTVAGNISGVTRPTDQLSFRYGYNAYGFDNNNINNNNLLMYQAFAGASRVLLEQEQYSYLKQTMKLGTDYKVNDLVALDLAYAYSTETRTENMGNTSSNSPQFGIRLFPTSWLNLIANYAYSERLGNDFLSLSPTNILTYKFYAGDDRRNTANFVVEAFPVNNLTFSGNFTLHNDSYNDSNSYGLTSDLGWSAGGDVSWTPTPRVALSLGYDHEQDNTKELASIAGVTSPTIPYTATHVIGDLGPVLNTLDAYDTVTAKADFKLIPDKLKLTAGASYSFSSSHFQTGLMPDLNEAFADISAALSYTFNQHWGARVGYQFEIFNMSKSYQNLYQEGATGTGSSSAYNQSLQTLDGFYRNGTASVFSGYVQYRF